MIPINNSDLAWLVVSDYNQDHGLPYEDLREDVNNPEINTWVYEENLNVNKNSLQLEVICDYPQVGGRVAVSGSVGAGVDMPGDNAVLSMHVGGMWEWLVQ